MVIRFIILFFLIAIRSGAQDFRKVVDELRQKYSNIESLHVAMRVNVFPDSVSTDPYYSLSGDVKRDRNNYRYTFGTTEMLMNEKYLIMVEKEERIISISKRDLKSEDLMNDPVKANLDSLLRYYEEVVYVGRKGELDQYELRQKKGGISKTVLKIDALSKNLRDIEYHYPTGQIARITFNVFDVQPKFEPDTFDEDNYVNITKDQIRPAVQFKGFVINSL